MKTTLALLALSLVACQKAPAPPNEPMPATIYDFTVKDIDGKPVKLSKFKGKVLMIVNTASKCGLTPQYEGLEAFYRKHKGEGLVVIGFPANNFMGQEPGTSEEIKTFCKTKYDVTFPMMEKISVKGDDTHELYRWLIANSDRPKDEIEWNFAKFLIGRDGKVAARFSPRDTVATESLVTAVQTQLSRK